ncbi:MAG TPA: hypothetical protein H9750_01455 [Candidatus Mediterraneibacter excrementavium]|nr:hypothetical protein [Candidatus Mediterraneibacter excrementavium]
MKLEMLRTNEKKNVRVLEKIEGTQLQMTAEFPVVVQILGGRMIKARYDSAEWADRSVKCTAHIKDTGRMEMEVTDLWTEEEACVRLERTVRWISGESAVRLHTSFACTDGKAESFDDYQFVFPGAFYNKNDTDGDGRDDYLGTYSQDYKDDRNPLLAETCYCVKSGTYLALIRADRPVRDITITREMIRKRHFVYDSDIGSLGFAPSDSCEGEFIFRLDYPFYERNSFCLNVDGSEWAGYMQLEPGETRPMSYTILMGKAGSLTAASWNTTLYQMDRLLDPDIRLPFTLEEAMKYRRELIYNSYVDYPDKKGDPAGFFIHFSPRKKYGNRNLLEYGFTGNQIMNCYVMLKAYEENGDQEYRRRALEVIRFFVESCIEENGLPNGIYNIEKDEFVYWWTGVLLPFQYSDSREELENYLGDQVVDALMETAEHLKGKKGNYVRTMVEAMHYLMLCYLEEAERGEVHRDWLRAVADFCDVLVEIQNENGSWNRAYDMEKHPITDPVNWFGTNEIECGSGSIFPIQVLTLMYEHTHNEKYRDAIRKAADFISTRYVKDVLYVGGLNDTTHKKSVKIDAVGVMYAMRSLLLAYECIKDPDYLSGARDAARILASWTYMWDIPFAEDTLLGKYGFKTTGWAGCDAIPACSYVDDEFAEFVPDLMKIAEYCCDERLAELGRIVTLGMHYGLSMPQNMYGYSMPGIQCEGYLTSLWLSDTEAKEFAGAVAKNKGDDNDTCNGLVAAQALYNLETLRERFGTLDFEQIKKKAVSGGKADV